MGRRCDSRCRERPRGGDILTERMERRQRCPRTGQVWPGPDPWHVGSAGCGQGLGLDPCYVRGWRRDFSRSEFSGLHFGETDLARSELGSWVATARPFVRPGLVLALGEQSWGLQGLWIPDLLSPVLEVEFTDGWFLSGASRYASLLDSCLRQETWSLCSVAVMSGSRVAVCWCPGLHSDQHVDRCIWGSRTSAII